MGEEKKGKLAEYTEHSKMLRKKELLIRILGLVILILFSVILCLITIMFLYGSDHLDNCYNQNINNIINTSLETKDNNVPIQPPSDNSTLSEKLKIVSRLEWLAQPPTEKANLLTLPVPIVIIQHTTTENCTERPKCIAITRHIQTYHMENKGWWDIGYNFLVGGDGYIYEGRGWKLQGAHTYGWNSKSIGISFIGNFNNVLPPERQILAVKMLMEKGVKDGYLATDYKLFAHRQLSSTQSPGEILYENIKTWSHWTENKLA